jgi:hypothetical protein
VDSLGIRQTDPTVAAKVRFSAVDRLTAGTWHPQLDATYITEARTRVIMVLTGRIEAFGTSATFSIHRSVRSGTARCGASIRTRGRRERRARSVGPKHESARQGREARWATFQSPGSYRLTSSSGSLWDESGGYDVTAVGSIVSDDFGDSGTATAVANLLVVGRRGYSASSS